jgi:NAD(P)-dependent dehydrogenase (short-subunit alcohol dehydrogenase family)
MYASSASRHARTTSGHIVNISSVGGRMVGLSQGPYCASKWALEAVGETLAAEVKPFGIHVAIVEPGVTATPIFDKWRQIPANTRYRLERRMNALFDANLKLSVSPFVVADKIVEIVESNTWKLRHPTGPDAEPFLQYRASITDEQWIDMQGVESDQEFVAIVKREFGIDLDLS